jgi:hypothetical protein
LLLVKTPPHTQILPPLTQGHRQNIFLGGFPKTQSRPPVVQTSYGRAFDAGSFRAAKHNRMKKMVLLLLTANGFFVQAQNVGIGTSNPTKAKLEVHGAVDATSAIFGAESSGVSIQRNWPGVGFNSYYGNGAHRYLTNGHGGVLSFDVANGFLVVDMFGHGTAAGNANFVNRAMVFSKEGWVSIGTPQAPTASLRVGRGVGFDGTAMFEGSTYTSYFNKGTDEHTYIRAGRDNGVVHINNITGGKVNMYGKVGINTTAVDYPFEIEQNGFHKGLQFKFTPFGKTWAMGLDIDGNLNFHTNGVRVGHFDFFTGVYNSVSDRRLKTNIQPLQNTLSKILRLVPVRYEMIHPQAAGKSIIGFLAQDVKEVFPELVKVMKDTAHGYKNIPDLHTLDYSGFGVLAVKAIQEQQVIIQTLQTEVAELRKLVTAMRKEWKKGEQ